MCGIVGYLGKQEAKPILLDCLRRLEYRGYDSAGIGVINQDGLDLYRCAGKNSRLAAMLKGKAVRGNLGIAHTRWATHGRPDDRNAHPHTDCAGKIAVVHNGIIENYQEIKTELESGQHAFHSDTDSEVIAHLFCSSEVSDMEAAALEFIPRLKGSFAFVAISHSEPEKIVAARQAGPPLVIGHTKDGFLLASDMVAIIQYTRKIQVVEDDEMAVITPEGVKIFKFDGTPVNRPVVNANWNPEQVQKGGYRHYMLKEIYEQPDAILDAINSQHILEDGNVYFPDLDASCRQELSNAERITIVACGTSWHAALTGRYFIECLARIPVEVDIASEYRYRPQVDEGSRLLLGISQSGETADTLGALKEGANRGAVRIAICNVVGSSMSREADGVIYTHAGPEIGVASTKAFTCQLTALFMFAVALGRAKQTLSSLEAEKLIKEVKELPDLIRRILAHEYQLEKMAEVFADCKNALYLGRGIHFPLAVEGALKLKEISYIHAEGYPAGELKHGPIALVEKGVPVVVLATMGRLYGKVVSAIEEVRARDGRVLVIATEGDDTIASHAHQVFYIPPVSELLSPILAAIPLQLLAYHIAVARGCDVDKPRNLAKSVTVE